jgi:hypothetical protein
MWSSSGRRAALGVLGAYSAPGAHARFSVREGNTLGRLATVLHVASLSLLGVPSAGKAVWRCVPTSSLA